jgi:hypothetical protein
MTSITAAVHRKIKTLISLHPFTLQIAVEHTDMRVPSAVTQYDSSYNSLLFNFLGDCEVCAFSPTF